MSVQKLRTALHAKAKEEPGFRFYALDDKICRMDVLEHAYARCRANRGAAGIDGLTFDGLEAYGKERWLGDHRRPLHATLPRVAYSIVGDTPRSCGT